MVRGGRFSAQSRNEVGEKMLSHKLQRAFEETHYTVHHQPAFTLRIGQHSPELDALLQASGHDCAAFITACNPQGQSPGQKLWSTRFRLGLSLIHI